MYKYDYRHEALIILISSVMVLDFWGLSLCNAHNTWVGFIEVDEVEQLFMKRN